MIHDGDFINPQPPMIIVTLTTHQKKRIMSPMHANPYDSVNIFIDTKCQKALGMHWGTVSFPSLLPSLFPVQKLIERNKKWVLTEEDVLEPPRLLQQALRSNSNISDPTVFDICDIGESRVF